MEGAELKPLAFGGSATVKLFTGSEPEQDTLRRECSDGYRNSSYKGSGTRRLLLSFINTLEKDTEKLG